MNPMAFRKQILLPAKIIFLIILGLGIASGPAFARELSRNPESPVRIQSIRIGPHPSYTRVLINLSHPANYKVRVDFFNKKITLTLKNVIPGAGVKPKFFRDKNLSRIGFQRGPGKLDLNLFLKNSNTRFFHFLQPGGTQIVLDLKGKKEPYVQTRIEAQDKAPKAVVDPKPPKKKAVKPAKTTAVEPENLKPEAPESKPALAKPEKPKTKVVGVTPENLIQITRRDIEEKVEHGWDDYQETLKTFQDQNYKDAIGLFKKFTTHHPDSKYLSHILYLMAEAEFNLEFKKELPFYENALAAYKYAMRKFPKSEFRPHALNKIAFIYNQMGYTMEAKTLYEDTLNTTPKSIYAKATKAHLATMLMKGGEYEEAYKAYSRLLEKSPKNPEARSAIFSIAEYYFEQKDFQKSKKIYEDGARRWPEELNDNPEIHFNMGEIYYSEKKYALARKHFFDLINLDPDSPNSHKALNRIGDSYLLEGKDMKALSVFDESARRNPGSAEMQYGKIRMADIGIRNPKLEVHDIVFDSSAYYKPFETYDQIYGEAQDMKVLAEITLSRGIAFFKEQNYLKAIEEFKKLLPLDPDSKYYRQAQKHLKQALILMIDRYSRQDGVLPILYSYSDFVSLSVGTIHHLKTLLQIGEAYQAVGMYTQALQFFERVKRQDSKRTYSDRIFINLGRIHLQKKNYPETRLVARSFLKNYPRSALLPEAMKLLAGSYKGQNQHQAALKIYRDLLKQNQSNRSEIHYLMAETYSSINKHSSAIGSYKHAISSYDRKTKSVPEYIQESYFKLGISLTKVGKYAEAIKALKAARQLFPNHSLRDWADYLLVDSYEKLNNDQQIVAELTQMAQAKNADKLIKKVAETRLKVIDWEKQSKEQL